MAYNLIYLFLSFIFVTSIYTILVLNPIHSILFLILTFINSAMLLIILGLDFLGLSIIIIYVGAVAILFLFIIMLMNQKELDSTENVFKYLPFGFIILYNFYINFFIKIDALQNLNFSKLAFIDWTVISNYIIIKKIGLLIYTDNFIGFFLIGLILLVSILIVIFLGNLKTKMKNQDLFNQIQF